MSSLLRLSGALLLAVVCASCLPPVLGCGLGDIDLSSLSGSDIQGSDGTGLYTYWLQVCGTIQSQPSCINVGAQTSTCQIATSGTPGSYDIGNWNPGSSTAPPTWGHLPAHMGRGVQLNMTGAQQCWATSQPTLYYAVVNFVCADSASPLTVSVPQGSCTETWTLHTPAACPGYKGPGSSSSGLSGGWIFIILLCVLIPVYIVVGCVYKAQKLGAQGMERTPNIEFWRELPGLVSDGCKFTVNKIRALVSGGTAVKDAGSYESM